MGWDGLEELDKVEAWEKSKGLDKDEDYNEWCDNRRNNVEYEKYMRDKDLACAELEKYNFLNRKGD